MNPVGDRLRQEQFDMVKDNMQMINERKQRESEMKNAEKQLFARPASSGRKPVELGENYIKMEILKNYAFPSTTNQDFIND